MGLLEVAAMHKVFWEADRLMQKAAQPGYRVHTASVSGGLIETVQGVTIDTVPLSDFDDVPIHTLVLPGRAHTPCDAIYHPKLAAWLTQTLPTVRRVIACGSATFWLAQIGVLKGKSAVIHCALSEALKRKVPCLDVDGRSLFTGDDGVWTFAGGVAAIDLALALVDADCGRDASLWAARQLAVYVRRPARESQLSEVLVAQMHERDVFHELHAWVHANRNLHVTVERMAEQVSMSARNFSRVYKRSTGSTPAKAVERFRLDTSALHAPS
jgi:transcriptional regulator GlxA family with amidase domain